MQILTEGWTLWIWFSVFVLSLSLWVLSLWNLPRWLWLEEASPDASPLPKPPTLDERILQMIQTLEGEGRAFSARDVWMRLTDDSTETVSERLYLLWKQGYFVGEISSKMYIGGTSSSVREGEIAGLTEKGKAALKRAR